MITFEEVRRQYIRFFIDDQDLLAIYLRVNDSQELDKQVKEYAHDHFKIKNIISYLNFLQIDITLSSKQIKIKLNSLWYLLDEINYNLTNNDCLILNEYPLFKRLFTLLFRQKEITKSELYQKLDYNKYLILLANTYLNLENIKVMDNHEVIENKSNSDYLTRIQEQELFKKIENNNQEAKNMVILQNQKLVRSIAKSFLKKYPDLELDDLIQDGNLGLFKAIEDYDYRKGFKFSTYAYWWIRQAIEQGSLLTYKNIYISKERKRELRRLRNSFEELRRKLNREPTRKELADYINFTLERIDEDLILMYNEESLDNSVKIRNEIYSLHETIPSEINIEEEYVLQDDLNYWFRKAKKVLTDQELYVLMSFFGAYSYPHKDLIILSKELNMTKQAVHQIKNKALLKLQRDLS